MAGRGGAADLEKLKTLCSKTYKEQAVWFMNAFWGDIGSRDSELFWKFVHKLAELDLAKKAQGNELDEFNAHRFFEHFHEPMTVQEMRDNLRSTGAISGALRTVPFTHILIYKYKVDWHTLVNASQGDNQKEIDEAQRMLDDVQNAYRAAEARAAEAAEAVKRSVAREAEAKASAEEAKVKEAESVKAKEELEAALAEVKAQEDAYNNRASELKRKSEDESIGLVTRNKAKAELAQHLAEDPLPLRKAKITQEAAVKKAERATVAAANAVKVAENDAAEAVKASAAAVKAREAAENAVEEMMSKVEEAEKYLDEVKSKPGNAMGALWWMDRELHEAKAYLPEKRGGYRKA